MENPVDQNAYHTYVSIRLVGAYHMYGTYHTYTYTRVSTQFPFVGRQHLFIDRARMFNSFCQETAVRAIFGGRESSRHILSTVQYRQLGLLTEDA
jgi:hypothetical protein